MITRRFGATSAVAKSVNDLEANPKSKGLAMVLSEHVVQAKAEADSDIMKAVSILVQVLKSDKNSGTSSVNIHAAMSGGIAGVVGAQNVSLGSVNVGRPRTSDKD